jgi:hypothetical protein
MLVLLVAATKILAVKVATSFLPALAATCLFEPATNALVFLKWIFGKLMYLEESTPH